MATNPLSTPELSWTFLILSIRRIQAGTLVLQQKGADAFADKNDIVFGGLLSGDAPDVVFPENVRCHGAELLLIL